MNIFFRDNLEFLREFVKNDQACVGMKLTSVNIEKSIVSQS